MKARRMKLTACLLAGAILFSTGAAPAMAGGAKDAADLPMQDFPWLWQMWIWKRRTDSARILNRRQRKLPENRSGRTGAGGILCQDRRCTD